MTSLQCLFICPVVWCVTQGRRHFGAMTRILNGKEKTMKKNVVERGCYVQLSNVQVEADNTNRPTHHRLQRGRELSDPGGDDNTSTSASLTEEGSR